MRGADRPILYSHACGQGRPQARRNARVMKGSSRHPRPNRTPRSAEAGVSSPPSLARAIDPDGLSGPDGPGPAAMLAFSEALNSKVLVLNRLYVAVRVISARRAFCLLMNSVAEIIHVRREGESEQFETHDFSSWLEASQFKAAHEHERYDWVRTVRYEVPVPRVIRLLGYDRLPEQIVKLNRRNLFARDRNQCQYCGRHYPTADLSIDHVVPRMQNGPDSWENLVCACIRCNARKGGRTPQQAGMKLIRPPERPRRNPLITLRLGHEKYASWKSFLDEAYWNVELR